MKGKACHPEITRLPTVWVRSGLSPVLIAAVVFHEARHIWQMLRAAAENLLSSEDEEADAQDYMWRGVVRLGFDPQDIASAIREAEQ